MQQFRDAVESRDLDGLVALFTDDVVFRSPVVDAPYRGRAQVEPLLRAVSRVFEDFRYTGQIEAPYGADHALVFRARVGGREIEGCDFIHTDKDARIDELYVMVRPLSGLMALAEAMKRQLEPEPGEIDPRASLPGTGWSSPS
jgi:ketosteroid isomerase-like protein